MAIRTLLSVMTGGSAGMALHAISKLIVDGMIADSDIPDNKITTGQTKARNSSASAMITWTNPSGEGGSNGL